MGIDESAEMLGGGSGSAAALDRVALHVARLEDALPGGPFDLVASALCVHHLRGPEKRDLFDADPRRARARGAVRARRRGGARRSRPMR